MTQAGATPSFGTVAVASALCLGAGPVAAQADCATTATPAFAGFDTMLMPVIAKRICDADVEPDARAIAEFLNAQGCAEDSGIAQAVNELLTHPTPEDFIAEFGAFAWDAIPVPKQQRFCETAAAVDLRAALTSDPDNPDPAVEKAFTEFFDAAYAIRED